MRAAQPLTPAPLPQPEETRDEQVALEPLYRVIVHNDDLTPMDFVVAVLERIFQLSQVAAVQVMLAAHHEGMAYVQSLPESEAKRRIGKAHFAAGLEGYPLRFSMEPE
jgi:ATP-dependent Clp protease adaptor protein ClpS